MNVLTMRALAALPPGLQEKIRAHKFAELDDLIGQVTLDLLEAGAGTKLEQVFSRARSAVRRFSQDPAHRSAGIDDEIDPAAVTAARTARRGSVRREAVLATAARAGITERAAQMRVKRQIERARAGDLFSGPTDDDGDEGEE